MKTIKTAVSLPAETYYRIEKMRKYMKKTRSEIYARALSALLKDLGKWEKELRDSAAYQARPETEADRAVDANVDWSQYFAAW